MSLTARGAVALLAVVVLAGHYRQTAAQGSQPNWKDRSEYALYESVLREPVLARKLDLLNSWEEKYPASDYANIRQEQFLSVYSQLGRPADVLSTAGDLLVRDPNNLQALSAALVAVLSLENPSEDQLATADGAANRVLAHTDTLFVPSRKPPRTSDSEWAAVRKKVVVYARDAVGYVAWKRKNYDRAESAFLTSLHEDPSQAQISYWLSSVILAQRKPEKYPEALYYMARAAAYDGSGSLPRPIREQVQASFEKSYITYHGSITGADAIEKLARREPFPATGFTIPSKADLARAEIQKIEELKKVNPQLALWRAVQRELVNTGGQSYFDARMKGVEMPEFKGRLVEARPEDAPSELVLAIDNGPTPDATLQLSSPIGGRLEPGTEIGFRGVPKSFTADPFHITFTVEKSKLTNAKVIPPPKVRRTPANNTPRKK